MIKQKDIRGFQCRYHRNGVAGNSFWFCSFKLRQGNNFIEMRAVVFDGAGNVAVTTTDIHDRWRGDDFEDVLRDSIRRAEANDPESCYGYAASA